MVNVFQTTNSTSKLPFEPGSCCAGAIMVNVSQTTNSIGELPFDPVDHLDEWCASQTLALTCTRLSCFVLASCCSAEAAG